MEYTKICVDCGKEFTAHNANAQWCMDCRYKHHVERVNENNRKKYGTGFKQEMRKCVDCGKEFLAKKNNAVRCPECRPAHTKAMQKEWNRKYRTGEATPKPKKKKDPNICTRINSCEYGGHLGSTHICDYLAKVGKRRPCKAGECTEYKRRTGRRKNVMTLDLRS